MAAPLRVGSVATAWRAAVESALNYSTEYFQQRAFGVDAARQPQSDYRICRSALATGSCGSSCDKIQGFRAAAQTPRRIARNSHCFAFFEPGTSKTNQHHHTAGRRVLFAVPAHCHR
eukprot:6189328-Pleurochrysis_carterae.AAC.2